MDRIKRNLWKKESQAVDAIYVDLFGDDTQNSTETQFLLKKSNEMSTKRRNQGNTFFAQKQWHKAMDKYNESLRFAEIETENISLAYANRSLCFFELEMYEKCLIDIELAKKANYPDILMSKIENRKSYCIEIAAKEWCIEICGSRIEL